MYSSATQGQVGASQTDACCVGAVHFCSDKLKTELFRGCLLSVSWNILD